MTAITAADNPPMLKLRLIPYNARLVTTRKARGFTQKMMGMLTGIRIDDISKIETLKIIPTNEVMEEIAVALNCPYKYLFPDSLMDAVRDGIFENRIMHLGPGAMALITERRQAKALQVPTTTLEPVMEKKELLNELRQAMNKLPEKERQVLTLRFGLENGRSHSLEDVGREFNVTKERIRQIEAKALRRLRHPLFSRKLRDYPGY